MFKISKIKRFFHDLTHSKELRDQIVYEEQFPEKSANYVDKLDFYAPIKKLLIKNSIHKLYSHQYEAIEEIRKGSDIVVSTPTASGKSLIYNIAVLENYLENKNDTALYLFPLKALAQDQLKEITNFYSGLEHFDPPSAFVYDGDTPLTLRQRIRKSPPTILITNPDMLHFGILPHHELWKDFFMNLKFIVVDEVHTYRGVMGSHMAWVFRRLIRICNFYGAYPKFIACSATIGNPKELFERLTGRSPVVISHSGSPRGKQLFLFMNPILYGPAKTAFILLKSAVLRDIKTIVYTNSRKLTELIGMWTKKQLGPIGKKISVYRAGLLPEQRREIEKRLMNGETIGVVSTSALEAGINIGGLDLCILVGYPGSVIATRQRAGRVGRKMQQSGVILMGGEDNLDQYILKHPEKFLKLPPEKVAINPQNIRIMENHLMCAAQDLPLKKEELQKPLEIEIVRNLVTEGKLIEDPVLSEIYCKDSLIHRKVHLRSGAYTLLIQDEKGDVIGEIDLYRAYHETYPGAIYLHNTKTYKVEDLNTQERIVLCKEINVKYYTKLITQKNTTILNKYKSKQYKNLEIGFGRLKIKESFLGFEKRKIRDSSLINFNELDIDPLEFETEGLWIKIPQEIKRAAEQKFLHFMGGIHGLEHLLIGVMPYIVLLDRNDIGGISLVYSEELGGSGIFIYDGIPGGIGISEQAYEKIDLLFDIAKDVIYSCDCEHGCFRCIHSPKCGSGNRPLDKQCTIFILEMLDNNIELLKNKKVKHNCYSSPNIIRKNNISFGVLDIETQKSAQEVGGWKNASLMRVSCAVLYNSKRDEYMIFEEHNVDELFKELKSLDLIIGYNIKGFDYKVLYPYSPYNVSNLPTLDLLLEIQKILGYRISLDNVASATLNVGKSANGMLALKWWKMGEIEKIIKYCKKDVELTKDIYLFGRANGYIFFKNKDKKKVKLHVTW